MRGLAYCMAIALIGCSPVNSPNALLDDAFKAAERGILDGELTDGLRPTIADGFSALPDGAERRKRLERFKEVVFVMGVDGADYNRLSKGVGRREILFNDCLAVAKRCGAAFSERMEFRMAFIRWLCAEYARRQTAVSANDDHAAGLHLTAELYLFNLNRMIYRNLEEMEKEFVGSAAAECSQREFEHLRTRIESFLRRPVRSREEIERRGREWRERGDRRNLIGRLGECPSWNEYFQ